MFSHAIVFSSLTNMFCTFFTALCRKSASQCLFCIWLILAGYLMHSFLKRITDQRLLWLSEVFVSEEFVWNSVSVQSVRPLLRICLADSCQNNTCPVMWSSLYFSECSFLCCLQCWFTLTILGVTALIFLSLYCDKCSCWVSCVWFKALPHLTLTPGYRTAHFQNCEFVDWAR